MADVWHAIIDGSGTLISTGTVIADDVSLAAQGYTAIALSGDPADMVWNASTRSFDQPPAVLNSYPKLAFIQRFTAPEFIAFNSSSDPQIQFFMYQLNHAVGVIPQDPMVQGALAHAVSLGLLTAARAGVIGAN